jgi:C1A family cysteine protease
MIYALAASFAMGLTASVDYAALFAQWKITHDKVYSSADAESAAFSAFAHNHDLINTHNARQLSYTLAHNKFSDMTADQFYGMYTGGFNSTLHTSRTYSKNPLHVVKDQASLPSSVDWVSAGAVTPVKDQGQCGSCWAFSTTGALEGAYKVAGNSLTSLSEEHLVQCDTVDQGCNGGLMDNAFTFVKNNGIATESSYPYTSGSGTIGTCQKTTSAVTITGYTDVTSGDENALQSAVAQQPVSIAIEADRSAFQLYSSGVLDSILCGKQLDHGVLVVGYGTDDSSGKDYWKVKNSWGASWGESGYIRMVRGKNMCGLATEPSYPTGAKAYSAVVEA